MDRRHPRRALGAVTAALLAMALALPAAATPRPTSYALTGTAVYPEGVAADAASGAFYVSSTNGGAIHRGHLASAATAVWVPAGADGRSVAVGLELDQDGRLLVAGGPSGRVWAYRTADASLVGIFDTDPPGASFINDIAVAPSGDAFVTDSFRPLISRVSASALDAASGGTASAEAWLDLTGTAISYGAGFNLNGIVATPDGRYLVVVQSNTGKLFRVDIADKSVMEIDLDATVPAGDGLVLRGDSLWVVQNAFARVAEVRLSGDLSSGTLVGFTTHPDFLVPTTAAIARGRMLVVSAQFGDSTPSLPFSVTSIPVP
ncbi:MAG TPA: SMP-30/gluconolactonase/LRE family protein [Candidatus Limnocylindrales bacterium]|nr:SMP-30/gluconolactonase/LRE family protein [Candidatus Limnocylindrales bacterium]